MMICVIGIDPGVDTGVAMYVNGKLSSLSTVLPWRLTDFQADLVAFEDSRQMGMFRKLGARQVGEIDAWCRMIEAICKERGIEYVAVSPKQKGKKVSAAEFREITGWTGRTNQHERDAAMVAYPYRLSGRQG